MISIFASKSKEITKNDEGLIMTIEEEEINTKKKKINKKVNKTKKKRNKKI